MSKPQTFAEYYAYYLTLHQNKINRRLHVIGQYATLLTLVAAIAAQSWLLVALTPFVVYPFAWSGHYFFENNEPAAFHNPIKAKISDWIMFKDILLGRVRIW